MMDKDYLYQIDIREWIERGLDADIMVPVSGNKIDKKYDIYLQSFLLPLNEVENDMENDTYNAHTLMPGITVYGSWEDDEKVYHRWGNDNGYEPLVIKREYNGVATDSIEIVEEFRLLFNLYFNSQKNEYIDVSNGEGITVVKMNDNGYVTIHKRYLKTYLAVKEKVLMIHIDSRCVSIDNSEKIKEDGLVYRNSENTIFYALNIGNTSTGLKRKNYSIIYAKNVVSGCSLCDSNIWPYNEEKTYVDFIIGIDENGKEIRHTCNPKELNNYFGANPTAPHYLTPVYFDSAVLNKYYSKPEIYKVEDGIIRCGVLWSLYIDNSNSDYVSAYLGDLGRDLPSEAEQHYWRGFNKSIGGKLSKTKIKRDFMCIASDSESPDFVFKKAYTRLNRVFTEKYGWPLFLSLTEQDAYNFEILRVPVNNSITEMDMLVLSLVKILIDSLNEKSISKRLTGNYEKLVGSISKIEAWLCESNIENYNEHIKFLRNLQELRFTKRRPTEKDGGVLSLLASVKGCLTYFQNGARNLSFNYKHHKDEDKRPGDDDYTFENAIESVLTEFHLSREQIRYLKPIVMGGQVKSKKDKKDSNGKMSLKYFDRSVYNRGFRYYDFIDDPNHSMRSEIQLFDFQDSPERILLHLSEKAQIIGISATASIV